MDENYLLKYFVTYKNFHYEYLEEQTSYGMNYLYVVYLHVFHIVIPKISHC